MSTAISQIQVSTILPKAIANLKATEEKPRFQRSTSIETIKRINTCICSPHSYLLPAILITWLKTGQNGLQASTERTIFMFRSLIFGSFLFRYLLKGSKSRDLSVKAAKLDLQTVLIQIASNLQEKLALALESDFVISFAFKMAVIIMTVQVCLCFYYLSECIVPVGLGFLILSAGYIVALGHSLNRFYFVKRDVKSKIN